MTDFKKFTSLWGIVHRVASPYHQQSNGKAEAAVKLVKSMMKKCLQEKSNMYLALLGLRNTPRQDTASPATLMFGRSIETQLPSKSQPISYDKDGKRRRQATVERYYNKNARNLDDLQEGQSITWKSGPGDHKWKQGQILSREGERSYRIQAEGGAQYRRNRIDIQPSSIAFEPKPEVVTDTPNECQPTEDAPIPEKVLDLRPRRSAKRPKRFEEFETSWSGQ